MPPANARLVKSLCWSEKALPQKERTKHVHSLHQYIGKFVPQLVSHFLDRDLKHSKLILDPFMGSGTTLVECNVHGIPSIGADISKFNVMMCNVKTNKYDMGNLTKEVNGILNKTLKKLGSTETGNYLSSKQLRKISPKTSSKYLNEWYHPEALRSLLVFRDEIPNFKYQSVLGIILSRAARSSRMIAHYETDFPKNPQKKDYYCLKHDRTCHPTKNSLLFLRRYCSDVLKRIGEFQQLRNDVYTRAMCVDSRTYDFSKAKVSHVFTSPPYIGLIDYHEQHRYAYELLGIKDNTNKEIGRKSNGTSQSSMRAYKKDIAKTMENIAESSGFRRKTGTFTIVVNDKLNLYDDIIADSGMVIKKRLCRTVNRRSGRRATQFYEDILVCSAAR